jgi:hypothetical protein
MAYIVLYTLYSQTFLTLYPLLALLQEREAARACANGNNSKNESVLDKDCIINYFGRTMLASNMTNMIVHLSFSKTASG